MSIIRNRILADCVVWVFFFYLFCILFTLRSLKIRYVIIFPPIFLSFFFSFFSCCNISGLSEKIWALNVKCSTSFSLSFTSTRLARFARFNVKMFVQKSFCGARSDTWADLYYCITMLHKDITTWHSQYDAVRHLSDDFKLHTQYNYMRKPSYTLLSQEGIFLRWFPEEICWWNDKSSFSEWILFCFSNNS